MFQLAVSGVKGIVLVAAAIPGLHMLTDGLENVVQNNDIFKNLIDALSKVTDSIAKISADIGNAIGVDKLAGLNGLRLENGLPVKGLTAKSFTDNFGIIPKVIGNIAGQTPDAINEAMKNPTPVIVGGTAVLGLAALDPTIATSLHDEGARGAKTVVNVANKASQSLSSAAQFTGNQVASVMPNSVKQPLQKAAQFVDNASNTVGAHTARLSAQMEANETNANLAPLR
jgi:hypothetical protein